MKLEILKKLILAEFETSNDKDKVISKIFDLLELYENDKEENYTLIPYHHLCGCNPENGGSGVCGCNIGNIFIKSTYKNELYESVKREREKFKPKVQSGNS